jgi:hypothetical protein
MSWTSTTFILQTTTAIDSSSGMNGYRSKWVFDIPRSSLTTDYWLAKANGPLTAENVFDYFATSMFYDKQSNNQVLRMQTMHTGVPIKDEAAELR